MLHNNLILDCQQKQYLMKLKKLTLKTLMMKVLFFIFYYILSIDLCKKNKQRGTPKKAKIGPTNSFITQGASVIPPEYENDPDMYLAIMASMQDQNI